MKRHGPHETRPEYLDRIFKSAPRTYKVYTLDGERIESMAVFCCENEIESADAFEIASMPVGASMDIGGGAFATFTLCRTR
jgi:hypothetical protein